MIACDINLTKMVMGQEPWHQGRIQIFEPKDRVIHESRHPDNSLVVQEGETLLSGVQGQSSFQHYKKKIIVF